jgi:hypothetical protein
MRKFLLGLPLILLLAQVGFSECVDTTLVLQLNSPGFTSATGIYDPDVPGAVNSVISACATDTSITIRINLTSALATTLKDTVKLTAPIKITGRTGKTTVLTSVRKTGGAATLSDSILTFVENQAGQPNLLQVAGNNRAVITNFGFARKTITTGSTGIHSITIAGKGSIVNGCHFWMLDNSSSTAVGALMEIQADSVLVDRCLFRAPIDGDGRSTAIVTTGTSSKIEIRASVFYSTGLLLKATGAVHVFANTFTGSRNQFQCIIISPDVTGPEKLINIQHNLFAPKVDTLAPIIFAGGVGAPDSILKNAYSRSKPSLALATNSIGGALVLTGATAGNENKVLPRGFSRYGSTDPNFIKDFPLTQLRTDLTLAANHPDFGKVFKAINTTAWTLMQDIKDGLPASKLFFPNGFTSFLPGVAWQTNIKVGAFVAADLIEAPSPLDSTSQGNGLKFVKYAADSTKIKLTSRSLSNSYYGGTTFAPEVMYFFFDTLLTKLTGSNDTTALKLATNQNVVRKLFLNDDSLLTVPQAVRSGRDIYVKMLHFRKSWQAPVLSNGVIATVTGVPSFPVNDLVITISNGSDLLNGKVSLSVTHGKESIDSIQVFASKEDGTTEATLTKVVSGTTSFDFTLPKGAYYFYAVPIAKLGAGSKTGVKTKNSATVNLRAVAGDTLYVTYKSGPCPGADGSSGNAFCVLDSAMKDIAIKGGGTVIIRNSTPLVAMEDITIAAASPSDTGAVTITNLTSLVPQQFDPNRPIFRGKTKEALVITRKNVTIKGFVIEMPAGSTGMAAVSVAASGVLLDANIFRTQTKTLGVEGPAVNISVGTGDMRMTNNVVWGFTKAVRVTNSASAGIRIINNTFLDDKMVPNSGTTIGISVTGPSLNAVIANNFFSNITMPLDSSVAKKTPTLDHNVFTTGKPNLQGLLDGGGLDSNDAARSMDLTAATYIKDLDEGLNEAFSCSSIHPCPALQASSSTTDYKVNLNTDVFGKARPVKSKRDVGAFEVNPTGSTVMGRLTIKPTGVENVYTKANFEISTKNYDSLESDSIHVWWSLSSNGVLDASVPASQQKHYPMSKLEPGSFSDEATGLSEDTLYYFYAAYGRTTATRLLGFVYRETLHTIRNIEPGDCNFALSTTVCPSTGGAFINLGGVWDRKFLTKIVLAKGVEPGSVIKNPSFESISNSNIYNLDLESPLPEIILNITVPSLGLAGSGQSFKATIEMDITPDLTGKELFLLPPDSNSLPTHVSTWQLVKNGEKSRLEIEGTKGGSLHYAFGKLADLASPGTIESADLTPALFDYKAAGDSINHITVNIKGTGFKTSNPLVLVSLVSAGATGTGVFGGKYPVSSLALSSDLVDLSPEDRRVRFYKYFLKAAGVESKYLAPAGQKKVITLDSVTMGALDSTLVLLNPNLALSGKGELAPLSISIPMHKLFREGDISRKATRSIEVVFTVFDGSKLVRTHSYIRTSFNDDFLQLSDTHQFLPRRWNLYGYPWDETETGNQNRIVRATKWDPAIYRLMKYNGSGKGLSAFTVYDGSNASLVKFDSGQAIWSGATGYYVPSSIKGMSLDYQPFSLALPAGQYTDISLPFNFPMRMKDILAASGNAKMPAMFRFIPETKSWEALKDTSILIPWYGMTIKPTTPLTLVFPIIDTSRSTATGTPKVAAESENQWTANIIAFNNTASMSLQIGKSAREGLYAEPPDVPGQDFRMVLKRTLVTGKADALSEYIQDDIGTWQGHWPLQASVEKGSEGLTLKVSDNTKTIPLYLVETLHQTVVPLATDSIHLTESDLRTNDYHLVAGDAQYLDAVLAGLSPRHNLVLSNYPNPFSGSTLIRYSLPRSFGKVDFLLTVRDFKGRTVFEKTVSGANSLNFIWDGRDKVRSPLPAGVYTLNLEAKVVGKPSYHAIRRLLKL